MSLKNAKNIPAVYSSNVLIDEEQFVVLVVLLVFVKTPQTPSCGLSDQNVR